MFENAQSLLALAPHCVLQLDASDPCGPFWMMTTLASAGAAMVAILFLFARAAFRRRRAKRSMKLWELEQQRRDEIAPPLRMAHEAWRGDQILAVERSQEEVASDIRDALRSRKLNGNANDRHG